MGLKPISSISLQFEYDLVAARRRSRQIAALLGFDEQDQTRIATVASEIARNALRYGRGGRIEFGIETREGSEGIQSLALDVIDRGPGIQDLETILAGRYESKTGMGIGILGARRLMDDVQINTAPDSGTSVHMRKRLPRAAAPVTAERLGQIVDELARRTPESPLEEIQQQNAELLQALAELSRRQEELERLNIELEDTNRGVLALYAELDENAESMRHANELKTRFLSDMSHEFRTPVNSILALTRLLDETDLGEEPRRQVSLIRRAATDLENLVSDLLDLAKIEAGKSEVRPAEVEVSNLFSALRGMLRPLLLNRSVSLVFEEPEDLPSMFTDEGKLSQILRNFISNALKFTEAGEVRVSACLTPLHDAIEFRVADTGIGIAFEHRDWVFEEFTQVDHPLQKNQKGTGLGLPLTRKLARLLGGDVSLRSTPGIGSTFTATIPLRYVAAEVPAVEPAAVQLAGTKSKVSRKLVNVDDETARYSVATFAMNREIEVIEADNGQAGIARAQSDRPDLILLDLVMPGIGGHEVLQRLKSDPGTAQIPVVIVTSRFITDSEREQLLERAAGLLDKSDLTREKVARAIEEAMK